MKTNSSKIQKTAQPPVDLQEQLAAFLVSRRGEQSRVAFAKQAGISFFTLQRLEKAEQNVRLRTIGKIMRALKCSLDDMFPGA